MCSTLFALPFSIKYLGLSYSMRHVSGKSHPGRVALALRVPFMIHKTGVLLGRTDLRYKECVSKVVDEDLCSRGLRTYKGIVSNHSEFVNRRIPNHTPTGRPKMVLSYAINNPLAIFFDVLIVWGEINNCCLFLVPFAD